MVLFRYVEVNCLHHAFLQLGDLSPNNATAEDTVAKSKLSVICLNIASLTDRRFQESHVQLHNYLADTERLTFGEFLDFLQCEFLAGESQIELEQLRRLCWHITSRGFVRSVLSNDEAYKVWMIFNHLNDDQTLKLDKDETTRVLDQFARGVGNAFNRKSLGNRLDEEDTPVVTFWAFLQYLEDSCFNEAEPNVYREVLTDIYDEIVRDVVKKGYMKKKGHKRHTWKERWFVLEPHSLIYYHSRDRMEEKGQVQITAQSMVEAIADKTNYKFRILVTDGVSGIKYELCAADQRSKMEWIGAIKHAIERDPEDESLVRQARLERLHEKDTRRQSMELHREMNEQQKKELDELRLAREEAEQQRQIEQQWLQEEMQRRLEAEEQQRKYLENLEEERLQKMEEERQKLNKEEQLEEEVRRRLEVEAMHAEQQRQMGLEQQKLRDMQEQNEEFMRLLQLEREKYEKAEEERQRAEELYKQALARGEKPERPHFEVKMSPGLARLIGPKDFPFATHRGPGAFPKVFSPDCEWLEKRKSRSQTPDNGGTAGSLMSKEESDSSSVIRKAEEMSRDQTDVSCDQTITVGEVADTEDGQSPPE